MSGFFEIIIQTVLSFFAILFITRILGRQQVAQLTVYEYINGITFGSIAANLATDMGHRTWYHFTGLILYGILTYAIASFVMKNRTAAKIIQGEAVLVIENGKMLEKNMHRYHYTIDDINVLLRKKDVFDIREVRYGILESTGELSIMKVPEREPVTLADLQIPAPNRQLKQEVVVTGSIIYENLKARGLDAKWLINELRQKNILRVKDVFYATLDENNQLYLDLYDDIIQNRKGITESDQTDASSKQD